MRRASEHSSGRLQHSNGHQQPQPPIQSSPSSQIRVRVVMVSGHQLGLRTSTYTREWMSAISSTAASTRHRGRSVPGQTGKAQREQMFSAPPPEADVPATPTRRHDAARLEAMITFASATATIDADLVDGRRGAGPLRRSSRRLTFERDTACRSEAISIQQLDAGRHYLATFVKIGSGAYGAGPRSRAAVHENMVPTPSSDEAHFPLQRWS